MSAITQCERCREYNAVAVDFRNQASKAQADYASLLARHNALVEAKETISECLQDTAFRNGVKAGWNAALIKDDAEAEKQYALLMADNDGRLATLKAARAEVDRLIGGE